MNKYRLHTDCVDNCYIVGDDFKAGMFDKLERKQCLRVIEKLNDLNNENAKLKLELQDVHKGYKEEHHKIVRLEEVLHQMCNEHHLNTKYYLGGSK